MQNKGAIRLFFIVLTLVCIYQLSFTFFSIKVERDARKYSQGDVAKERAYLDSISDEVVFNFLWLRKFTYMETKEREINLGLDLKGGMNVVLEISVEDVIRSLAAPHYLTDPIFTSTLERARQNRIGSQEDFVVLFAEAFQNIKPGGQLAQFFMTPETRGEIDLNTSNSEVVDYLRAEAESAISNSFNVLRNRIDRFGVVQPNIQRLERQGRILVELPGVKDPERVTKLLTGTANLEFWTTYDNAEILPYIDEANNLLRDILAVGTPVISGDTATPADQAASIFDNENDTVKDISIFDPGTTELSSEEVEMERENPLFAVLIPYLDENRQAVGGSVMGISSVRDTAKVNQYLAIPQVRAIFPADLVFAWHSKPMPNNTSFIQLHALKASRERGAALSGRFVTDARQSFGQFGSEAEVYMTMNSEGAKRWANLTRENIGRSIAIMLDDYVVSAPVVRSEIKGGGSTISGNFTQQEAIDLANTLKSGKMPARARVESSEVIGPSLGQASIQSGLRSFIMSFVIVLLYMVFYYSRRGGMVADLALLANMFFLIGVLASLQAVLTLPGIAGIVLTIGMSVDANVLIYERIREELAAGKGTRLAISDGYKNAYSAIIDANVTTLLTGLILYFFGTGPIKGFATTLVIGIITSLLSAIFITRLVYEWFLTNNKSITFSTKFTENAFKNVNFDFLKVRKSMYVVSGILIILSIGGLVTKGLHLGVDFTGGRNYVIEFKEEVPTQTVRDLLEEQFGETPQVITFGDRNRVRVTTKILIEDESANVDSLIKSKIYTGLIDFIGPEISLDYFIESDEYIKSSQKVGPAIADDIKQQAVFALFLALLVMFIYIILRFKNWQFGFGAVAALIHDSIIVLGIFAVFWGILPFSLEVDQAFIAAILTVVGYSINDTVVVFDRIRENRSLFRKRGDYETINRSLNNTLSRTFSTSFTTFLVILIIFLFGGEVIRGFTFALLIGIIVGTYSSLFIATPLLYETLNKRKGEKEIK
jgi:SecD/SecF fusion protein